MNQGLIFVLKSCGKYVDYLGLTPLDFFGGNNQKRSYLSKKWLEKN